MSPFFLFDFLLLYSLFYYFPIFFVYFANNRSSFFPSLCRFSNYFFLFFLLTYSFTSFYLFAFSFVIFFFSFFFFF
ncbi:UNVERIFIED_CONTAM: hypothetical protein DVV45_15855, partial [Lactiplantibacillus plantarum]|nr:hypothetical protein [Lactiplantibacillus plantarum]